MLVRLLPCPPQLRAALVQVPARSPLHHNVHVTAAGGAGWGQRRRSNGCHERQGGRQPRPCCTWLCLVGNLCSVGSLEDCLRGCCCCCVMAAARLELLACKAAHAHLQLDKNSCRSPLVLKVSQDLGDARQPPQLVHQRYLSGKGRQVETCEAERVMATAGEPRRRLVCQTARLGGQTWAAATVPRQSPAALAPPAQPAAWLPSALPTSRRILWSALPSILALLYRFRMTGAPLARHTPLNTLDCLQHQD